MKLRSIAPLVLAFVVVLIVGCGSSSQPAASPAASGAAQPSQSASAAPAKEPVTVEEKLAAVNKLAAEARQAKLIEEAKKEGKIVLYITAEVERLKALEADFKAKFPFLTAEFTRVTTEEGIQKASAQAKAGKQLADVVSLPAVEFYELQKQGFIAKYLSPERKAFSEAFMDKEGYWTAIEAVMDPFGYNKDLVKAADVPKTYDELLDPKWKGKLGRTRHGGRWLAAMYKVMGEQKALEYAQKLAQQNVTIAESNSQLTQFLASGEVSVAFDLHASTMAAQIKKGAPIGVFVNDPLFFSADVAGITSTAPHPYAAALMIDWFLSKEVQEIIAKFDWGGGRTDVQYPYQEEVQKVKTQVSYSSDLVQDKYDMYQSKFEELFLRR